MSNVTTEVKSINDVVRDKVKETFVNLIPDDQWDSMVSKCTKDWMEKELPQVVAAELKEKLKPHVAREVEKSIADGKHDYYGKPTPSSLVETIVRSMTPDLMTALIGGIVQEAVNRTAQNMRY